MNPHWSPFHLLSFVFIGGGFVLIASAWKVLYEAQLAGTLAVTGAYAHMRHPQYAGFISIMVGFFLQWPTLVTAVMLPILVVMYLRLAKREEREVVESFGEEYRRYAAQVPAFIPRLSTFAGKKASTLQ
jgi:protein-S-isoprenylcysteine O-methyltransferase Ste14